MGSSRQEQAEESKNAQEVKFRRPPWEDCKVAKTRFDDVPTLFFLFTGLPEPVSRPSLPLAICPASSTNLWWKALKEFSALHYLQATQIPFVLLLSEMNMTQVTRSLFQGISGTPGKGLCVHIVFSGLHIFSACIRTLKAF